LHQLAYLELASTTMTSLGYGKGCQYDIYKIAKIFSILLLLLYVCVCVYIYMACCVTLAKFHSRQASMFITHLFFACYKKYQKVVVWCNKDNEICL
jgi:hypothetical protein